MQASLDGGDGLFGFSQEDGLDAKRAGSSDVGFDVVQEDDLCGLHTKALAGEFKDAPLRLGNPLFMGINEEVAYLSKLVALLLFVPGTGKEEPICSQLVSSTVSGQSSLPLYAWSHKPGTAHAPACIVSSQRTPFEWECKRSFRS